MKKLIFALTIGVLTTAAFARDVYTDDEHPITPFTFAFASPLQVMPKNWDVYGLRLDLFFGRSFAMRGLDLGLVGRTDGELIGLAINAFDWVESDVSAAQISAIANVVFGATEAFQVAGFANYNHSSFYGFQTALVNRNGNFDGMQLGVVNCDISLSHGFQIGVANLDFNEFGGISVGVVNNTPICTGLQIGFVNLVEDQMTGVQIGAFNGADKLSGVQIGLINSVRLGCLPVMPVLNANF